MGDSLGPRGRIGIVVPSTNTTVQPESEACRPRGVTNHVARISIVERKLATEQDFLEHVQSMRDGMGAAIDQVMTARPTWLIMGVAIEAFWGGVETARALQRDLEARAGVGVSMGSTAVEAALHRLGAGRIAVLTPHQPRGDEQVARFLTEAGFEIVRLEGLKCASPLAIAEVPPDALRDSLRRLDGPDVEAIVQVGTNLAMAEVAVEAERWLGKPVLSINVVTYWDALRRQGIDDKLWGCGSILERF